MLNDSAREYRMRQEAKVLQVAREEGVTVFQHAGLWHLTGPHCDVTARELWTVHESDIRRHDCAKADRYRRR